MAMMDDVKGKMGDMGDDMRDRMEELRTKQENGELNDTERQEFNTLRERFEKRGND